MYKTGKPVVSSSISGDGSIRVRHREYLYDVLGATNFTVSVIPINPGLTTFTWLSQLANLYESYVFNSLSFDYESVSGTGQSGSIMMAIDFDAADSAPVTKQEIMTMQGAVRTAPWQSCVYDAASQNLKKFGIQRYVRFGPLEQNLDIKTYDVGNLFVAVTGAPSSACGEVYVTYDVTLHTPQPNIGQLLNNYSAKLIADTGVSNIGLFGSGFVLTGGYPLRYKDANSIYCDVPGQFLVSVDVVGTGIDDSDGWTVNPGGSGSSVTIIAQAATGTTGTVHFILWIKNNAQFFVMSLPGATTVTNTTMRVAAYNYALG